MRIPGNKVKHLRDFFFSELNGVHEESEITAMFQIAAREILGYSATELLVHNESNINQSDLLKLYDCAKDLKKNIPLQYILGNTWFYDLKFLVNKNVLIPRPETEELVEIILNESRSIKSVLDIGTGSGCIPVSIKKNLTVTHISACDISEDALKVARRNAELNQVEISFIKLDILSASAEQTLHEYFDLIVSNPPYIKRSEGKSMSAHVTDQEPHLALFVDGEDDIIFYRKIIDLCQERLNQQGFLYFELNPLTSGAVKDYAENSGIFKEVELRKDLSGNVRFLKAVRN